MIRASVVLCVVNAFVCVNVSECLRSFLFSAYRLCLRVCVCAKGLCWTTIHDKCECMYLSPAFIIRGRSLSLIVIKKITSVVLIEEITVYLSVLFFFKSGKLYCMRVCVCVCESVRECVCVLCVGMGGTNISERSCWAYFTGESYILWFNSTAFFSPGVEVILEGEWKP